MKNNVIWVDFTSKNRNKSKQKKILAIFYANIKELFKFSDKYRHTPKPGDKYHKSIL